MYQNHRPDKPLIIIVAMAVGISASSLFAQTPTDTAKNPPQPQNPSQQAQPTNRKAIQNAPKKPVQKNTTVKAQGHGHAKPGLVPPKPTVVLKPGEVPKIEFDTPTYDFGRVKAGQTITHDFWFTNTGTGPLEILQVRPG